MLPHRPCKAPIHLKIHSLYHHETSPCVETRVPQSCAWPMPASSPLPPDRRFRRQRMHPHLWWRSLVATHTILRVYTMNDNRFSNLRRRILSSWCHLNASQASQRRRQYSLPSLFPALGSTTLNRKFKSHAPTRLPSLSAPKPNTSRTHQVDRNCLQDRATASQGEHTDFSQYPPSSKLFCIVDSSSTSRVRANEDCRLEICEENQAELSQERTSRRSKGVKTLRLAK
ncbi:hypothetical protein C8F01DRAFT_361948 [Mycena amicta]|nr:hypothetical protein C8F01DRAFT_361948 [Mycena amicta]